MATDFTNDANCIGAWKMNESSGDIIDQSSEGNDGSVSGASYGATGPYGGATAVDFDGVNDWIDFGDVDIFDGKTAITCCLWIYCTDIDYQTTASIVRKDGTFTCFQLRDSGAGLQIAHWNGGLSVYNESHSGNLTEGNWHHYCVRWSTSEDSGKPKWNIDGTDHEILDGSGETSAITSSGSTTMRFGATEGGGEDFKGRLAEVIIFDRYITDEELDEIRDDGMDGAQAAGSDTTVIQSIVY